MKASQITKAIIILIIATLSSQTWISTRVLQNYSILLKNTKNKIADTEAAETFENFVNNLLDNKIIFLMNEIEATYLRASVKADEFNTKIEYFISYIHKRLAEIFVIAVDDANLNSKLSFEELYDKMAEDTNSSLTFLIEEVERVTGEMLNKMDHEYILNEDCTDKKVVELVTKEIKEDLSKIPNPWEKCRENLEDVYPGIRYKLLSELNHEELYSLKKCRILKKLDKNTSSTNSEKYKAYYQIFKFAGNMRCANVALNSPSMRQTFMKEMVRMYSILAYLSGDDNDYENNHTELKFLQ